MKVAILLSGQPRNFDKKTPHDIKTHLSSKYDCDFFCHFWWSESEFNNKEKYSVSDYSGLCNVAVENNVPEQIIQLYNPKAMEFESSRIFDDTDKHRNNTQSQFYSLKKSFLLFDKYRTENQINYNWVIRMRYEGTIDLLPDLNKLIHDKIYVRDIFSFRPGHSSVLIQDIFWISAPKLSYIMFSGFDNIELFKSKNMEITNGEDLLLSQIIYYNIYNDIIKIPMNLMDVGFFR